MRLLSSLAAWFRGDLKSANQYLDDALAEAEADAEAAVGFWRVQVGSHLVGVIEGTEEQAYLTAKGWLVSRAFSGGEPVFGAVSVEACAGPATVPPRLVPRDDDALPVWPRSAP